MPPTTKKLKPDEQCLICKAPKSSKPGAVFSGKGSNGMIVKFWLCDTCAAPLAGQKGVKSA